MAIAQKGIRIVVVIGDITVSETLLNGVSQAVMNEAEAKKKSQSSGRCFVLGKRPSHYQIVKQ